MMERKYKGKSAAGEAIFMSFEACLNGFAVCWSAPSYSHQGSQGVRLGGHPGTNESVDLSCVGPAPRKKAGRDI